MAVAQAHDLAWKASVEEAKEQARKESKPILLDFSAAPM